VLFRPQPLETSREKNGEWIGDRSTGVFIDKDGASKHIQRWCAKKSLSSGPEDGPRAIGNVCGPFVNEGDYNHARFSTSFSKPVGTHNLPSSDMSRSLTRIFGYIKERWNTDPSYTV